MNRTLSRALKGIALAAVVAAPFAANAESNFQTGAANAVLNATAKVDFTIIIPKVLFLQVGTGALFANNGAVDMITFDVPAAAVGNGVAVNAAAASGDLGNGTVTAMVRGNGGNVTLSATTPGAIGNGAGDSISWGQITTTAAALNTANVLPAPVLVNGNSAAIPIAPVAGKIVNQDARWTYTYANSAPVAAGTYGGLNVNNGRVTYTAALP
jgi:hypothetical protein